MARKKQKSKRGIGDIWDEVKRTLTLTVTPTAVSGLDEIATELGYSKSELVERIGRRLFTLQPVESNTENL